jgi:hypothetical protein
MTLCRFGARPLPARKWIISVVKEPEPKHFTAKRLAVRVPDLLKALYEGVPLIQRATGSEQLATGSEQQTKLHAGSWQIAAPSHAS